MEVSMPEENDVRVVVEDDRTGMSPEALRRAVLDHLRFTRIKDLRSATPLDVYHALAHAARDRLVHRWIQTKRCYARRNVKRAYYLSAEYLTGRQLAKNLLNLDLFELARYELAQYELDLQDIIEQEEDPGLGNGGLGRLAACYMDSLATLGYPAAGYGIRYEFGIFRQEIDQGWQVEQPDEWLRKGNPWEVVRNELAVPVRFGGHVEQGVDESGRFESRWRGGKTVIGVPYDMPIAGFGNNTVNTLRLWSARASEEFELAVFNDGEYRRAVEEKALSESISKVLYPKDESPQGKELRLKQQYFFVCCSIQDIMRRFRSLNQDIGDFPDKVAIQLNDTHPAIAVAELMRVLVDLERLDWSQAWSITERTIAYTNHTLLPEALECWKLELFERLLPRHLQIIYEINKRFLRQVHIWRPGDEDLRRRMSIIDESKPRKVRMAHLATVGSHKVNGVAALHSQLLRERVLADFARFYEGRFTNVTNGVTPRRWLLECNPPLAAAITERIGKCWTTNLCDLAELERWGDDPAFLKQLAVIKRANKERLADHLARLMDEKLDVDSLVDVQVKRIHEYKRQLLACLHVVWLYQRIKFHDEDIVPRTVLIGGKAAPGYTRAKHNIKLINDVAAIVNSDPAVRGRLKLLFLPNYNVSFAQLVIPAADLSEQISLAGKEASGTGNMKFQMNGALTIGTLDGANIEIRDEVGEECFFTFGMEAEQARQLQLRGYDSEEFIERSPALRSTLELIERGTFNPDQPELARETVRYLREEDPFMICADFDSYLQAQARVAETWQEPERWWSMVALNIARSGRFSSDRSVREYAERIWGIEQVKVELPKG